jgi:CDP-diglyceride synthetase
LASSAICSDSLLKRSAGVRNVVVDSGHGGVLDRIDSWLFGPLFYVFVRYL